MPRRFKKKTGLGSIFLPGLGKIADERVLEGDDLAKFVPALLEEITAQQPPEKRREDDTLETGILMPGGGIVKGAQIETKVVETASGVVLTQEVVAPPTPTPPKPVPMEDESTGGSKSDKKGSKGFFKKGGKKK